MAKYKLTNIEVIFREDGACIPKDERNADYVEYLAWVEAGNVPDSPEPIAPESPYREFDRPVKAPDFIVASPKPKTNPKEALFKAVGEARKGHGVPKSSMTILLNLIEYIDDLEKRVDALEKARLDEGKPVSSLTKKELENALAEALRLLGMADEQGVIKSFESPTESGQRWQS